MDGHQEDTELLGLLRGQEKGSEGYKGDGISIKGGMVEPCPVKSNCGSCWGTEGGNFGRHGQERLFMQQQQQQQQALGFGFGFSSLDPEYLTSSRGSWLLGRKGLWKQAPRRCWV